MLKLSLEEFLTGAVVLSLVTPEYQVAFISVVMYPELNSGSASLSSVGFASSPEGYASINAFATSLEGFVCKGSQQATS